VRNTAHTTHKQTRTQKSILGGKEMEKVKLSNGKYYTPKKGKPPVCPCLTCKDKDKSKWDACNNGWGVCSEYMDYEHAKCLYNRTVF
jgi:hypothetical protein